MSTPSYLERRREEVKASHDHVVRPHEPHERKIVCKVCCDITDRREAVCPGCNEPWEPEDPPGLDYVLSLPRSDGRIEP